MYDMRVGTWITDSGFVTSGYLIVFDSVQKGMLDITEIPIEKSLF